LISVIQLNDNITF